MKRVRAAALPATATALVPWPTDWPTLTVEPQTKRRTPVVLAPRPPGEPDLETLVRSQVAQTLQELDLHPWEAHGRGGCYAHSTWCPPRMEVWARMAGPTHLQAAQEGWSRVEQRALETARVVNPVIDHVALHFEKLPFSTTPDLPVERLERLGRGRIIAEAMHLIGNTRIVVKALESLRDPGPTIAWFLDGQRSQQESAPPERDWLPTWGAATWTYELNGTRSQTAAPALAARLSRVAASGFTDAQVHPLCARAMASGFLGNWLAASPAHDALPPLLRTWCVVADDEQRHHAWGAQTLVDYATLAALNVADKVGTYLYFPKAHIDGDLAPSDVLALGQERVFTTLTSAFVDGHMWAGEALALLANGDGQRLATG